MKTTNIGLVLIAFIFMVSGCGQQGKSHTDTSTSGVVNISADDSYKPIIDAEIEMFEALYPHATIHVHYTSEDSAFNDLTKDSARVIVVGRKLTKEEENFFHSKQLFPEQVKTVKIQGMPAT
jgi:phosphate transport system substrate-binding protein